MKVLLEVRGVRKRFGSQVVVDSVDLEVSAGEAVGLIGSNGAGKSTLFSIIAGTISADDGSIFLEGRKLPNRADERARRGIARTFQIVQLFGGLSVLDHLLVALQAHNGEAGVFRDLRGNGATTVPEMTLCMETLELCGIAKLAHAQTTMLSLGQRRTVELARALVARPKLLLTDEPSSGLDESESLRLAHILNSVRRSTGVAVVIVEHDLATVAAVAERVVALDAGRVIANGTFDEVIANVDVRRSWLGEASA
jgi:branched-chain amino acid transport system ATP-binding protein